MIGLERIRGGIAVRKIRERAYIRKHQLVSTGLNVRDRENLANFQFSKKISMFIRIFVFSLLKMTGLFCRPHILLNSG